ncbi:hypothetical protein CWR48_18410 [Oceanobacillus arenosus]|uniref:Uncharacterized protein n=1 Tax=Oceanobacillus arenosus TaxID=1229153 RepID=A0A3D8PII0_9BACI|nr:hypothetical protein [Oceanobacillus arenosus]RDW15864.1 hypothetical protein CWR48_18410 [Oceanobacillus arenosus]
MIYNFIEPKKPVYKKGVLVIHSDDGGIGDYNSWYPLFLKKCREYSGWDGDYPVVNNSAISTGIIDTFGFMMRENLYALLRAGWEMMSHGRHHVSIGLHPVIGTVSAGSTSFSVGGAAMFMFAADYKLLIYDENNREEVQVKNIDSIVSSATSTMHITSPLINNYTNAKIRLTDESARDLLQGCVDDAKAWGIDLKHHVYTYHAGGDGFFNERALEWVNLYFESGRGRQTLTEVNDKGNINLPNLISTLNTQASNTDIDKLLDLTAQNDQLFIFYGHGEGTIERLNQLEYLIDGAFSRGIRIMRHSDALKHYNLI